MLYHHLDDKMILTVDVLVGGNDEDLDPVL
jgi:hypothetical protein